MRSAPPHLACTRGRLCCATHGRPGTPWERGPLHMHQNSKGRNRRRGARAAFEGELSSREARARSSASSVAARHGDTQTALHAGSPHRSSSVRSQGALRVNAAQGKAQNRGRTVSAGGRGDGPRAPFAPGSGRGAGAPPQRSPNRQELSPSRLYACVRAPRRQTPGRQPATSLISTRCGAPCAGPQATRPRVAFRRHGALRVATPELLRVHDWENDQAP